MNVFDTLKERGLIAQATHEEELRELLGGERATFYIGFDATADSLHVGHFLQMIVMRHMQMAGHRPIALIGGGTTMVGDPTGKTDMRRMMTMEEIAHNCDCFKRQMERFIDFSEGEAIMVNNADWLLDLNYVDFLREVGVHFSVNRMLTAECFKSRLEKGLSFIEFNYMLMQSYDYLVLNRKYGCNLEMGGDDQWSNILGGIELVRRVEGKSAYGLTFTLLTNSEGKKMGKTENGALWLDADKVSPYEFYQYWRNVDDADAVRFMKLMTFVPIEEIKQMEKLEGQQLNAVKARLAFEITALVHGASAAGEAQKAAMAVFGGADDANMPAKKVAEQDIQKGVGVLELLLSVGFIPTKSEGRRLAEQGGLSINGEKVELVTRIITPQDFTDGKMIVKKGKKAFLKLELEP